ncbi:MAG TPA: Nramp family divalent metal transporter [Pirellulales bacterium]|nr:Nramp family divalent metal transporter [Pirellulales bacterium]
MAAENSSPTHHPDGGNAGALGDWHTGELPAPPSGGWHTWAQLLGPGVLLAGASIGSGEWLSGPAVSAQYGATLLWVATLSIVAQVFCNLEMMRYTLYCGEPIVVGFFRTRPGPRFWTFFYLAIDFAAIWPFNASNAAVPLAAAFLGHLPGTQPTTVLGLAMDEDQLVKYLGFAIFLLAFLPLIFGGTIYRMLERVMAVKLLIVLGYLILAAVLMVSGKTAGEICSGFVAFGDVPLRPDTIVAGRHFNLWQADGAGGYRLKGTIEKGLPEVTEFIIVRGAARIAHDKIDRRALREAGADQAFEQLLARAEELAGHDRFFVEDAENGVTLSLEGSIDADRAWLPERYTVADAQGRRSYPRVDDVPAPWAARFRQWTANEGLEVVGVVGYLREQGRLPPLDWAMVATFAAIAGAGGMSNTLFSNYTREKGWGMGKHVGAIPSAIGGRQIKLSHVGMVFHPDAAMLSRWRGWFRHILRDQLAIWMLASFIGMALPCMLSLEFIRHAPVAGNRVAAMTAEGMAQRYPQFETLLWSVTLSIGFLILAPGQILTGDQIARRWTDIIWTASPWARRMREDRVAYLYYAILAIYCVWGLVALALCNPLEILKIAGVLMNVALGFASWHTLYVNRSLMPPVLRPNRFMQAGTFACGAFFLGISVIGLMSLLR